MPEEGHLRRLLPIVRGLHARGHEVHVFTHNRFLPQVTSAGGRLFDLFSAWPLAAADAESRPVPCRYVSFAGHYAAAILEAIRPLRLSLVVYDTFAVIGRVIARELGVPGINVCAGHNVDPATFLRQLETDPRVAVAPACHAAVERLRGRHGIADASPFAYVNGMSPTLNIYCEPPEFLAPVERRAFEPLAFFGSLPSIEYIRATSQELAKPHFTRGAPGKRIYIGFGTVVWRYYAAEALAAMEALADAIALQPDLDALISFGGADAAEANAGRLRRANVRVEKRVDQWAVLGEADLFVTHHGLNSTHEAIFNRVPMLSYPFFWDQPGLAAKCQAFGIARPLAATPRAAVTADEASRAINGALQDAPAMARCLDEARNRELAVMAGRSQVLDQIAAIARGAGR
ncbi:MAG: glycosyltransferase family 1 protein [Chromatiales bacterium]|nr:glycosyltransferase family 1 protein [Chromatiales bacterium]